VTFDEVLVEVAAKVGRVVAVDGGAQAGVEQFGQVVLRQIVFEHAQLDVGQRAHRERHALARQALHQGRVLGAAHAVVDALHLQHVERGADVGRRALLARMGHQVQARVRGSARTRARTSPAGGRARCCPGPRR
jgi:predicted outer membrane lipoprotein